MHPFAPGLDLDAVTATWPSPSMSPAKYARTSGDILRNFLWYITDTLTSYRGTPSSVNPFSP